MKKSIIHLIKNCSEKNDTGFRNEAYEIVRKFNVSGNRKLSEYVIALIDNTYTVYTYFNKFFTNLKK